MKRLYILAVALFLSATLYSQNVDSLWVKANELYANGMYEDATNTYLTIVNEGKISSDLYYNLGNAYFKQNMLGNAILSYERALRLAPTNEDIIHNLEFARSQVLDKVETIKPIFITRFFSSIQKAFTTEGWATLGISLFAIGLLLILCAYFLTAKLGMRRLFFWLGIILIGVCVGCNLSASNLKNRQEGVVLSPLTTVKSSPDASGKEIFIIHEGTKVRVIDELNGWKRIMLEDKKQGWVPDGDIEKI